MAITYPLSLPSTTAFSHVRFSPRMVVAEQRSPFTLQSQVQVHQGQLWQADIALHAMKRPEAEIWLAFFLSLNGREGTFLLYDPAAPNPRGSVLGTPLVNGGGQTGRVLNTKGWTPNETGVLLKGDYLSLGTGVTTRLYKVLDDVDSDGSGLATVDIWPRLRESPSDSDPITTTQAKGTFRLAENQVSWDVNVAQFYNTGFSAVEAY